jgi:cupin superfamily acireductone dioxygenase involved in methionine salvage
MANDRRYELEELVVRPGTYFNPQTEVMVVVDDSPSLDTEIFNLEEFEGADWVLISDDVPVDEAQRDEMMETFQARHHGGDGRVTGVDPETEEPIDDDEEEQPQGVEELE